MSDKPNIGSLYERVVFQNSTVTKSPSGEEVLSWATYAEADASVNYMSVGETDTNERLGRDEKIDVTIRIIPGLTPKMRLLYEDRYYDLTGIVPLGRRFQQVKAQLNNQWTDD